MARVEIKVPEWLDKICAWPVLVYRKHKYGYTYRRIPLGEGKFTIVDPVDYYRFNKFNWCPMEKGPNIYAIRLAGDPVKRLKIISLHREIMNNPVNFLVDHRNGNSIDNRRENLREATRRQNICNRAKTRRKTSSRFIGVTFDKSRGLWRADIRHFGKKIFLGYFKTEIEAARAHDRAAIKYHGEFARLNFPREDYVNEIAASNSK